MHNLYKCCVQLVLQWMFCNVYPQTIAGVAKCVTKILNHTALEWLWKFAIELQVNLFDVEATEERTLYQEKLWGVKMTDLDKKFYEKTKPCSMCWLFFNTHRSKVGNKP